MPAYQFSTKVWHGDKLLSEGGGSSYRADSPEDVRRHLMTNQVPNMILRRFPDVSIEEVSVEVEVETYDFHILHLLDGRVLVQAQTEPAKAWMAENLPKRLTNGQAEFALKQPYEHGFSLMVERDGLTCGRS